MGTLISLEKFTKAAGLPVFHSIPTITVKKVAVSVTNTTESPDPIRKNTQIPEFSVVPPEQSKFFRSVDAANISMISRGDPNLATYMNELLRTCQPKQQSKTFWIERNKGAKN